MASKKSEIAAFARGLDRTVTPADVALMRDRYGPVSDGYLRRVLLDSSAPLHALVEGVRQESFESLERTLLALEDQYRAGVAEARSIVISAKDHAKLAARREGAKAVKDEMVLWMLTWLENPAVFREWLGLRKAAIESRSTPLE